jgi:hypothetical protein
MAPVQRSEVVVDVSQRLDERGGPAASRAAPEVSPPSSTEGIVPDAEQVEAMRARTLLELAGVHTRQALQFPDDVANLQTIAAELLLEVAMLRLDVRRLTERVEAQERRAGVSR